MAKAAKEPLMLIRQPHCFYLDLKIALGLRVAYCYSVTAFDEIILAHLDASSYHFRPRCFELECSDGGLSVPHGHRSQVVLRAVESKVRTFPALNSNDRKLDLS